MTKLRIGVVGTGRMAATMLTAMTRTRSMTAAGVVSASGAIDRAREFATAFGIGKAHGDLAELLGRDDIDLVYIATSTFAHAEVSAAALQAGKSVLCEKPCATSHGEAQMIADAARRSNGLFMEAIWPLFLPAYRRAGELIRSNAIGTPTHFSASFGYPISLPSSNAAWRDAVGTGVLLDRAVYPVSLAISMMGPVKHVASTIVRNADNLDIEANLQLVHESGGHSQLAVSFSALLSNTAIISGTGGSVTLVEPLLGSEGIAIKHAKIEAASKPDGILSPRQSIKERLRAMPAVRRLHRRMTDGARESHPYRENQFLPMLEHVLALSGSGKRESEIVPLNLSVEIARVVDRARTDAIESTR